MAQDIYQEVTNTIIQEIEDNKVLPWQKDWQTGADLLPVNFNSGQYYNGINILILWVKSNKAGFTSNQWMTYKQAQDKGLQVRKNEKSTRIVYYKTLTIDDETEN